MSTKPVSDGRETKQTGHREDHGQSIYDMRHKQFSPKAAPAPRGSAVHMADRGMQVMP